MSVIVPKCVFANLAMRKKNWKEFDWNSTEIQWNAYFKEKYKYNNFYCQSFARI